MEINLGKAIKLTKEETEELYAIRDATLPQLVILAEKCGKSATIIHDFTGEGYVALDSDINKLWEPRYILDQNHLLLSAVISQGDCRLFYDDGIEEYFIYQYDYQRGGPPLAHNKSLSETVFAAAMQLWIPED